MQKYEKFPSIYIDFIHDKRAPRQSTGNQHLIADRKPVFNTLVSKAFRFTATFTKNGAIDISEFVKPENPYAYSASEGTLNIPAYNPKVVMYKTKSE